MSRRWRGVRPARSRRWDPPWTPAALPPPILRPRRTAAAAKTRRGVFLPVVPPASTWVPPTTGHRAARPPTPRRGTFQPVIPTTVVVTAAWAPPIITHRMPAARQARRGRYWPMPTAATQAPPQLLAPARRRVAPPSRRGAFLTVPGAPLVVQDLIVTSAGILPGWWSARLLSGVPVQRQKAESLEYVPFAVGTSLGDPTAYAVEAAFALTTAPTTETETWAAASWVDAGLDVPPGTYVCQCLVGPGGAIELEAGTYVCYVRIHADPETPVRQAGLLNIY